MSNGRLFELSVLDYEVNSISTTCTDNLWLQQLTMALRVSVYKEEKKVKMICHTVKARYYSTSSIASS